MDEFRVRRHLINYFAGLIICSCVMLTHKLEAQNANLTHTEKDTPNLITYPPLIQREGKGLSIPKPPPEHPRLYLNRKIIPSLISRSKDPVMAELWNKIILRSSFVTDGKLESGKLDNDNFKIRDAIECKALLYVLLGKQEDGKLAVSSALNYYKTLNLDEKNFFYTRNVGRAIVTGALIYDWCYSLLSKKEKDFLINKMESMATTMEIKWPLLVQGSVVSHATEAQLSRDMLSCGIATYDERPEIYNLVAGRLFAEFVDVRKYFYPGDYHHQGSGYGPYRYGWDMFATFLFDRMGYPNLYGKNIAKAPYIWMYTRRPDGQFFRNGDDFDENYFSFGQRWTNTWLPSAYAGSYFRDPVLMAEAVKDNMLGKGSDYIFDFLFYDPTVKANPERKNTPLTKYFDYPYGAMIARTGWSEDISSNDVVAEMKIVTRYFANHQHLDAGSFQLYYKGPLTVQSGIYQGQLGTYGGVHFSNYSQRTIAHNSMLILDPNEKFYYGKAINDGGQRMPNNLKEPENLEALLERENETGDILAHKFGPDTIRPEFSYLKGDLKKAYSDKVKGFKRSFIFLNLLNEQNPAALIVFDAITTSNRSFQKYWLLHSVAEPMVAGNETTITMNEPGYTGQMVNTTLFPVADNLEISKIGGKGHEYEVFGKNFPNLPYDPEKSSADRAFWRIEVKPKIASATDNFLNVMQVINKDGNAKKLSVEKLSTTLFLGALLQDRVALFSKDGELIDQDFEIIIPGNAEKKIFIADLTDGKWIISNTSANVHKTNTLVTDDHVVYFTSKPGRLSIRKIK